VQVGALRLLSENGSKFLTLHGALGIGPCNVTAGDMLCHVEGSDQHFVVIRHLFDEEEFHLIGPAIILRRRCDKDDKNASADEQEGVSRYCAPYVEDDEEDESYEQGLETHFPNAEGGEEHTSKSPTQRYEASSEQEEEQERIPIKYQSPYAEDADDEEEPLR
jgi:hypothetical protein